MRPRPTLCLTALVGILLPVWPAIIQARAADQPPAATPLPSAPASPPPATTDLSFDIDVISRQLDTARQQIQPSLGATVYNFTPAELQTIPQGDNSALNQVLLQAPGTAQDSFGQIHLRGEHANVQYRLNGVELPEGLSVFGQAIESRFANSMSLITGALPAQYGFQTAGVVDIQTKTGITNPGLTLSTYGGSWNWAQPSFEYGGQSGRVNWFITGDYLHNDRGIENPDFALRCDPRHHQPVPRPGLCRRHRRSGHADQPDPRRVRWGFPNSQQSGATNAGVPGQWRVAVRQQQAEREPA